MPSEPDQYVRDYFGGAPNDTTSWQAHQVDGVVNDILGRQVPPTLLCQLAEHYSVAPGDLLHLLAVRQLVLLHSITDYNQRAGDDGLQVVLKSMNRRLHDLTEQMNQRLHLLDEAIVATEQLQAETAHILASLKN